MVRQLTAEEQTYSVAADCTCVNTTVTAHWPPNG